MDEMKAQSIRFSLEFEQKVKAFIARQIVKESFNSALIKLATFAFEFFKLTGRIDVKVLEDIKILKESLSEAQDRITFLENEIVKTTNLASLRKQTLTRIENKSKRRIF